MLGPLYHNVGAAEPAVVHVVLGVLGIALIVKLDECYPLRVEKVAAFQAAVAEQEQKDAAKQINIKYSFQRRSKKTTKNDVGKR